MAALEQGRFAQARADLLRAVQADPNFAGAWLDLAIATHGAGDSAQAEEFLGILQDRFELPPAMAAGVVALRERIARAASASTPAWTWRGVAQLGAGYDTNANAGLLGKDLTLSFPGGAVTLPVVDALRPRADSFLLAGVSTEGRSRWNDGHLEVAGSARVRRNAKAGQFDTEEIQAAVAYESAQPAWAGRWGDVLPGPWRVAATAQQSRLGSRVLFNSMTLGAVHAWRSAPCGPQASVDVDFRGFPQARNLGSVTLWAGLAASCSTEGAGPGGAWKLRTRIGHERARDGSSAGRTGGDTTHAEFSLARQWSWVRANGTHRAEALVQWAAARDSEGYSPLLENNARRSVDRWTAGVAYTVPMVSDGWSATLTFQGFRQDSNLELFRIRGEALQLTVQRAW